MGEWTDAMDDGVICRGCALPMGAPSATGYCPDCRQPPQQQTTDDSAIERAREWKAQSEK